MVKKIVFLIMFSFLVVGCKEKTQEMISDELTDEEIVSCLENKLGGYLASEKNNLEEVNLDTFTNEETVKIFKAVKNTEEDIYVVLKDASYELLKDMDLYFNKDDNIFQTYLHNEYVVYFDNRKNDLDLKELDQCFVTDKKREVKNKEMDSALVDSLQDTTKIEIKNGDKVLGAITSPEQIAQVVEAVKTSKQYGEVFLCDGTNFKFEMYNEDKLLDSIWFWSDGKRLNLESQLGGCAYYSVTNGFDFRKLIEQETSYLFFNVYDYQDEDIENNELIYQDKDYKYYLKNHDSKNVLIRLELNGLKMNIKKAIDDGYLNPKQLEAYDDMIVKKKY